MDVAGEDWHILGSRNMHILRRSLKGYLSPQFQPGTYLGDVASLRKVILCESDFRFLKPDMAEQEIADFESEIRNMIDMLKQATTENQELRQNAEHQTRARETIFQDLKDENEDLEEDNKKLKDMVNAAGRVRVTGYTETTGLGHMNGRKGTVKEIRDDNMVLVTFDDSDAIRVCSWEHIVVGN